MRFLVWLLMLLGLYRGHEVRMRGAEDRLMSAIDDLQTEIRRGR